VTLFAGSFAGTDSVSGCVDADPALIKDIRQNPTTYYVNVHAGRTSRAARCAVSSATSGGHCGRHRKSRCRPAQARFAAHAVAYPTSLTSQATKGASLSH
jgi:hypothetical protein